MGSSGQRKRSHAMSPKQRLDPRQEALREVVGRVAIFVGHGCGMLP
jgi:hypothetical protein